MIGQIVTLLNQMAEIRKSLNIVDVEKQAVIDSILTPEIRQQIADIEAEYAGRKDVAQLKYDALEEEVKKLVKDSGETVKGLYLQAVWTKGREKVDFPGLRGYGKAHPEVMEFISEGSPSVAIRKV